jgi:exosortase N
MGLNMLISSLLISVMFIGFWMQKNKKVVAWYWLLLYGITVLLFNVLGNLFRIIILVQFSILPGTIAHDVAGIICLLLYVLLPTAFIARYIVNRTGKPFLISSENEKKTYSKYGLHLFLVVLIVFSAYRVKKTDTYKEFSLSTTRINKYHASEFAPGIIKLESNESLIYVKHVRGFYDTDHNPTICWKGSGFEFQEIEQIFISGYAVFTALLVNNNERLYTAWWYGNGKSNTNDQFAWRWDMIKGAKSYAVINVTAPTKEKLQSEVKAIFQNNSISPLFK